MSRKHYQMIADGFKTQMDALPENVALRAAAQTALYAAADAIAYRLAQDNPRFDRSRFMRACGF